MLRQQLTERQITDLEAVLGAQPLLRLEAVNKDGYTIRGALVVRDEEGAELDSFAIELFVPMTFPEVPPTVLEVGGRIPRILDRHIHVSNGTCCIQIPVAYYLNKPSRLVDFVIGAMQSYFIAQLHFEQFGTWPYGELEHGYDGLRQFCEERLGSSDLRLIRAIALLVPKGRKGKHASCPCGSHRKILRCHERVFRELRRWPLHAVACVEMMADEALKASNSSHGGA